MSRMRRLLPLCLSFAFGLLATLPASAQLVAAKDGPIVYGHHHVNASNMDEHKKFWIDALGGTMVIVGPEKREVIKFHNALLLLRAQKPTGGTKGTTFDHVGFSVPNLRQVVNRIKAGGFRMVTSTEAPPNIKVVDDIGVVEGGPVSGISYAMGPDDVKVEILEMKAQTVPISSHHLHFFGANKEMQAWYIKTFGAAATVSGNPAAFVSAGLPGLGMNFSPATTPVVGTQGRVVDHIGFEVKNLEAFTKQLEAQGIKLTSPYRPAPALGLHIAFITDPWGTYIELTEGLDKIN
jgi:predicted enzyme related to lactoylglutathione lyase